MNILLSVVGGCGCPHDPETTLIDSRDEAIVFMMGIINGNIINTYSEPLLNVTPADALASFTARALADVILTMGIISFIHYVIPMKKSYT